MGTPLNFEPQPGVYFVSNVGFTKNPDGTYAVTPGTAGSGSSQNFSQQPDVSVGTSSMAIAPVATTARKITVTHPGGSNTVFIATGKAAVLNSGVALFPGGSWTSDPTTQAVNGITSTGTETVTPYY